LHQSAYISVCPGYFSPESLKAVFEIGAVIIASTFSLIAKLKEILIAL